MLNIVYERTYISKVLSAPCCHVVSTKDKNIYNKSSHVIRYCKSEMLYYNLYAIRHLLDYGVLCSSNSAIYKGHKEYDLDSKEVGQYHFHLFACGAKLKLI